MSSSAVHLLSGASNGTVAIHTGSGTYECGQAMVAGECVLYKAVI